MLRRLFILGAIRADKIPPGELDRLNEFADLYNKYVASLQNGVSDLRLWRKVVKAWNQLT